MSMLEIPGVFTMLVPDGQGWAVTQQGNTYELTKPGDDVALHVSVYQREPSALGEDEAATLLGRFISAAGGAADVSPQVLKESRQQHRAVARFRGADESSSFEVLAFLVLWRDTFLMCSCTAPIGSSMPEQAEQMFATIFPPKKGFMRRRR